MTSVSAVAKFFQISNYKAAKILDVDNADLNLSQKAEVVLSLMKKYMKFADMYAYASVTGRVEIAYEFTPCILEKQSLVLDSQGMRLECHNRGGMNVVRHIEW